MVLCPFSGKKNPATPVDAPAVSAPESILNLTDLKNRSMQDLMALAEQYQVDTASSMRKQELIFCYSASLCIPKRGDTQRRGA